MRGDPSQAVKVWLDKLAEADRMRRGYQEQIAKGLMTLDELDEQLKRIEETRKIAQEELAALEGRCQRLEELEHDRDALLERYAGMVPEALDGLGPEERHRIYKMLRLKVLAYLEARLEVSGVLGAGILFVFMNHHRSGDRSGVSGQVADLLLDEPPLFTTRGKFAVEPLEASLFFFQRHSRSPKR